MNDIKYPDIDVQLTGTDGNAFALIGKVSSALRQAKVEPSVITEFQDEATSGDYDHLLRTCCSYVNVA